MESDLRKPPAATMTRRLFSKAMAALLAAGASLPTLLFWWRSSDSTGPAPDAWVDLGAARKIPEGEWLARKFSLERRNRWRLEVTEELVYLRRLDRDIKVLSPVCPHARCLVHLRPDGFSCSCHRSSFSEEGQAIDGPAPRGLDPLEWKVKKGRLLVKYQRFRPGIARSEVLST